METEYENGLLTVGASPVVHFINPVPNGITPYCKPKGTVATIRPTKATEATCRRCIRKDAAAAKKVPY